MNNELKRLIAIRLGLTIEEYDKKLNAYYATIDTNNQLIEYHNKRLKGETNPARVAEIESAINALQATKESLINEYAPKELSIPVGETEPKGTDYEVGTVIMASRLGISVEELETLRAEGVAKKEADLAKQLISDNTLRAQLSPLVAERAKRNAASAKPAIFGGNTDK